MPHLLRQSWQPQYEYHQPAIHQVTVTRKLGELDTRWVREANLAVARNIGAN